MKYVAALLTAWVTLWVVAGGVIALCYARHIAARLIRR